MDHLSWEEPREISRKQRYLQCKMSKLGYCNASNREMWAAAAVALLNFKWKSKGILFCFHGNVISIVSTVSVFPIFTVKLNISFLLGNVYFDVNSWGERYGVLTAVSPDTQGETGKFLIAVCVNALFELMMY